MQPIPAVALAVGLVVAFAHAAGEHVGVEDGQHVQDARVGPAGGFALGDAGKDVDRFGAEIVVVLDG